MAKRLLIVLAIICLVLSACATSKASPIEDFSYQFINGETAIVGYHGSDLNIVVPSIINERPVTNIAHNDDSNDYEGDGFESYDLKSIVVPEGVTKIHFLAFNDCKNLETIKLPDSLKYVYTSRDDPTAPNRLFEDTRWYQEQPDGLLYIDNVLVGCKGDINEDTLVIKDGTKSILAYVFGQSINNVQINNVVIPNSVKYIGKNAFYSAGLSEITVPDGVVLGGNIGNHAIIKGNYTMEKSD